MRFISFNFAFQIIINETDKGDSLSVFEEINNSI